jgi:hypothetical protein
MQSSRAPSQTDELARRPVRTADYAAENRALVALARTQAGPRSAFLQAIADTALTLCRAGAQASVLPKDRMTIGSSGGSRSPGSALACVAIRQHGTSARAL